MDVRSRFCMRLYSLLPFCMIIAHIGLDGSGKSYGMAQDAIRAKKSHKKEPWSLFEIKGVNRIKHPHQILYLEKSVVYLDELQRFYPPNHTDLDEITMHIISTHRHDKNVIHWSAQDWKFVHPHWRYETSFVWLYEPIHRDNLTGESNWFGTGLHRHMRRLVRARDVEREYRRPEAIKTEKFWITKKGIALFNSYGKIPVHVSDEITSEYIANLVDPHYLPENLTTSDHMVRPDDETPPKDRRLIDQEKDYGLPEAIPGKNKPDDTQSVPYIVRPGGHEVGKRMVGRKRQKDS